VTILDDIFIILCCDYFDEIFNIFEKINKNIFKTLQGRIQGGEGTKKL
jgi:hypothetical protein